MTSQPIRDQVEDHLLTPKNSALLIIDYQPLQVSSILSMDRRTLVANIVAVAKVAKLYGLPIVLSTVNVKTGAGAPTIHQLADLTPSTAQARLTKRLSRVNWLVLLLHTLLASVSPRIIWSRLYDAIKKKKLLLWDMQPSAAYPTAIRL